MRFHLIDRITEHELWKSAKGLKNLTKSDDMISENENKKITYSNNLLCESVFQTLACFCITHRFAKFSSLDNHI